MKFFDLIISLTIFLPLIQQLQLLHFSSSDSLNKISYKIKNFLFNSLLQPDFFLSLVIILIILIVYRLLIIRYRVSHSCARFGLLLNISLLSVQVSISLLLPV